MISNKLCWDLLPFSSGRRRKRPFPSVSATEYLWNRYHGVEVIVPTWFHHHGECKCMTLCQIGTSLRHSATTMMSQPCMTSVSYVWRVSRNTDSSSNITSHHITSHLISYIMSRHVTTHIISYHIISYHIIYHIISYTIPYHTIPYHAIPYNIISYRIVSYCTVPYRIVYIMSYIIYHIISYHIISYHIIA